MSEYWVSKHKYYCKYCEVYIADDAPSRNQHENGLRHQGNKERFIRNLYKTSEKRKQELDEEKREIAQIDKAAEAAYLQDIAAGLAKPGSRHIPVASSSVAAETKTAVPRPSNPYANYSTAESLGFTDPDAERANAEAELRRTQGVAGDWQIVEVVHPQGNEEEHKGQGGAEAALEAQSGEKRAAEVPLDDEDTRAWKLRRKTASVGLGDVYDPAAIPIKLKPKKEEQPEVTTVSTGLSLGGSEMPKWSARGWSKPGTSTNKAELKEEEVREDNEVKVTAEGSLERLAEDAVPEGPPALVKSEEVKSEPIHAEIPPVPAGSLFKKRKAPVGGSRNGRRI